MRHIEPGMTKESDEVVVQPSVTCVVGRCHVHWMLPY